jgi:dTDP-4-dehydrorhamnose 3,5-epimerase
MIITKTEIEGIVIIQPKVFSDSRGYFLESFNSEMLRKEGIVFNPVQDNESKSVKGVVRGLHYQLNPHSQAKLVRVVEGKIFDVVLDLRRNSKTFGQWFGLELDSDSKKQLFIPHGFAHGYSVLSEQTTVFYKCDNFYHPQSEGGVLYNDPALGIDWKVDAARATVSDKDKILPTLEQVETNFVY